MDLSDIKKILFFLKKKLKKKVILMYGFQAYPTRTRDLRFGLFRYFKKLDLITDMPITLHTE